MNEPKKRKKTAKRPERLEKGKGGVESRYGQFRARKRKKGFPPLYGQWRETYEEALQDRPGLDWEPERSASQPLLRDFMGDYLVANRLGEVEYGTWKREEIVWRTRVFTSRLGQTPLDQIDDTLCQEFIDAQIYHLKAVFETDPKTGKKRNDAWKIVETSKPLAFTSRKRICAAISNYFEIAKEKKLIKINPIALVTLRRPKRNAKGQRSLMPKQAAGLKGNLLRFTTQLRNQGQRFEAMVLTSRDTGFRRGELCGLLRNRVNKLPGGETDGAYAYILVNNGLVRVSGGVEDSSTKTGNDREVPITKETYERIMALPARVDPKTGQVYAFSTASGKAVRPDNFTRSFRTFRNAIGLPGLKLHHLRHTYISLMLRAGVDLKTIQKNVGHATPRMIMEVYAETFDDQQRASVDKFAQVLAEAEAALQNEEKSA